MTVARTLAKLAVTATVVVSAVAAHAQTAPLTLTVYHAGPDSFNVNSVLIAGKTDAVLVDTGFTRADAMRIAAMVLDSHKSLKTIYISQPDPDYYFGIDVLKAYFPDAKVVATAPTVKKIEATLPTKLAFWPPKMGANAPKGVSLPEVLAGNTITLEGQTLEIRGTDDRLPHRSYVWIPSLKAVVGGVNVFAGLHVWTADASSAEDRAAWSRKLGDIAALKPAVVVPGHSAPGAAEDVSQVAYTQAYLQRWDVELKKANNSAELIGAMKAAYPTAGLGVALDIGAKVAKGEMAW
ncbi:MBL fold metallo-hydrolase [Mitsuaria sp. GD03876]|uniref:MBL fold metallo-hydrolase n=1 Tax=Mitsuaria sp. GD03876 TaxID=2975399 RepID=UPI002447C485|nr:MBL fold metallo-hydrolase [Mitsuaria sp. GD03876]MDH0862967.1 MBL fold metallo-hydrolase [Mitsuaria sp. GD03876]